MEKNTKSLAEFLADENLEKSAEEKVKEKEAPKVAETKKEPVLIGGNLSAIKMDSKQPTKDSGIIPALSPEDRASIRKSLFDQKEVHTKLVEHYIDVLLKCGYSQDEIKSMTYTKIMDLGRALEADMAEGTLGDAEDEREKIENPPEVPTNEKIDTAVKTEEKKAEIIPVKTEEKEEVVDNEVKDEVTPPNLKELLKTNENIYVHYTEKPLNAYRRNIQTKNRKLIERQKRGRNIQVYLPNSNIKLAVYELHQPSVIQEIFTVEASQTITAKRKTLQTILERSSVIAADGEDVTVDGLMNFISQDDIPYIYLAAAVANAVKEIPLKVMCRRCRTESMITLDSNTLIAKAMQDIPDNIIADFREDDKFEDQINKSLANKVAVVEDTDALVRIELKNPSIRTHVLMGESARAYVVEAFANLLPQELLYAPMDTKFEFLFNLANSDIGRAVQACIVAQFVEKITFYNFKAVEGTEWNDDRNIEIEYTLDDTMEAIIDAIASLEKSTYEVMQKVIEEQFVNQKLSISTGSWSCSNPKCKHIQETNVEGLELLMSSLLIKM